MPTDHPWPNPYRKLPANPATDPAFRYSRGYLPHLQFDGRLQVVTYWLADSMPQPTLEKLRNQTTEDNPDAEFRRQVEMYLDAGYGACWLRRPEVAGIVRNAWEYFEGQRYRLHAWVIMPNHVHLVVAVLPPHTLRKIVTSWKTHTAKQINRVLGRNGPVWQREHWDRFIRDQTHYDSAMTYIRDNPVEAGLVDRAEQWRWSSWFQEGKK